MDSIDIVTSQYAEGTNVIHSIPDYAADNVSKKSCSHNSFLYRLCQSYRLAQRRLISSLMTKNKVLIFGATGMAGHIVLLLSSDTGRYEVCECCVSYETDRR